MQLVDLHINPGKLPRVARHIDGQDTIGIEWHKLIWCGRQRSRFGDRQIGFRQHVIMADEVIDMQAQDKVPCIRLPHIDTTIIRVPVHITRRIADLRAARDIARRLLAKRVRTHTAVLRSIKKIQPRVIGFVTDVEFIIFNLDLIRLRLNLLRAYRIMRPDVIQELVDSRNLGHIFQSKVIERIPADTIIQYIFLS